jgi:hypothetical protein
MLDLSTGTRIYVRSRLYNKNKKIRSYTPFFRLDETLLTNGLTKKTAEPISIRETTQSTKQLIFIEKREKQSR